VNVDLFSLEEIRDFSVKKTLEVGEHTPVYTGSYDEKLIIYKRMVYINCV